MRVLFVTTRPAWPPYPGYQLRTSILVEALAAGHELDCLFVLPPGHRSPPLPPHVRVRDARVIEVPRLPARVALPRWMVSRWPWPLMKVSWEAARPTVEAAVDQGGYDLVWASPLSAWPALPEARGTPMVVDFDDLDDRKIAHRQEARKLHGALHRRDRLFAAMDRVDVGRFQRANREVLDRAEVVTVCSDLDRARLGGHRNVAVVPNGYRPPDVPGPLGGSTVGPPTLVYVGDLTYRPNVEAATLLATRILPIVRAAQPSVRVRLVGRHGPEVAPLGDLAGIDLVGEVPAIAPELTSAHVSVVPLLSGGGTRIKILEAFAYGVPVVSTTIGAEGLDVTPGEHLLIADDPEGFAGACIELLRNDEARRRLATSASARYLERYTPEAIRANVEVVVEQAISASAPRREPPR